jgi:hypothetical protein
VKGKPYGTPGKKYPIMDAKTMLRAVCRLCPIDAKACLKRRKAHRCVVDEGWQWMMAKLEGAL